MGILLTDGGGPHPRSGWGVPHPAAWGGPHRRSGWMGVPSGYPPTQDWMGYPTTSTIVTSLSTPPPFPLGDRSAQRALATRRAVFLLQEDIFVVLDLCSEFQYIFPKTMEKVTFPGILNFQLWERCHWYFLATASFLYWIETYRHRLIFSWKNFDHNTHSISMNLVFVLCRRLLASIVCNNLNSVLVHHHHGRHVTIGTSKCPNQLKRHNWSIYWS